MKKLIIGTLTAATVIGSVAAASAAPRQERGWFDLGWTNSAQYDRNMQDPNKNFPPDSIK